MNNTAQNKLKLLAGVLFAFYIVIVVYLLLFADAIGRSATAEYHYNLIPFREISRYFENADILGDWSFFMNTFGNVFFFLPFGFLLPAFVKPFRRFYITIMLGMVFSALMETLQLITRVGSFDVDDIILNTLGAVLGYVIFKIAYALYDKRKQAKAK